MFRRRLTHRACASLWADRIWKIIFWQISDVAVEAKRSVHQSPGLSSIYTRYTQCWVPAFPPSTPAPRPGTQLDFSAMRKGAFNATKPVLAAPLPHCWASRIPRKAKHWFWRKSSSLNGKAPIEAGGTTGQHWMLPKSHITLSQGSAGQLLGVKRIHGFLAPLQHFVCAWKDQSTIYGFPTF